MTEMDDFRIILERPGLSNYQKARGIDTSKRKRIS